MSFRPRVAFLAAVLALVGCVAAGITFVRIDLERAHKDASLVRFDMSPLPRRGPGLDGTRVGSRARSLRFSPVKAAGRYGITPAAHEMSASDRTGALSPAAAAMSPGQPRAASASNTSFPSGAATQTIAPPPASPAIIGEFAYRMESAFRDQLDAVMTEARAQGRPARMTFPVADGRTVDLVITQHDAQDANHGILYARVDDRPFAQVVLAYGDEAVAGSIVTPDGEMFIVRYAGGGVHRTLQLDPNRIADETAPLMPEIADTPSRARADLLGPVAPTIAADQQPPVATEDATDMQIRDGSNTVIDVMIVYTPESRANNGGVSGMNTLINAAVAKANLAFANSNAGIWLRLVHTAEVSYTSAGSLGDDLGALRSPSDLKMDNVYALRTQYNVDLVSLFVPGAGGVVGIAYLLNPATMGPGGYDWVFSVVVDWAADGNISFAHEVGHNLGAGHTSDGGCGVYSYACGYRFTALGESYRTVMAYSPGLRIPYFSNPDLTYQGVVFGNASANNALALRLGRQGIGTLKHGAADWTVSVGGDFNQDDKPDLLARNVYSGVVNTWLMDNATRTSSPTMWPATNPGENAWVPMATGDFNADTKDDIIWRNTTTGRVIVWFMDGTTRTGTAVIWAVANAADAAWLPMAVGDFNADTKPDIIWRNQTTGRVIVWYMDGVTRTSTAVIWAPATPADAAWVPLAAGDFDADNKPDLIWRNQTSGRVIFWFMDGATRIGTFALWPATNPGDSSWRPMATGDFNADGQLDIVWRNTDTGRVIIWYMNGTTRVNTAAVWS
jgi:hypothetical protein